MAFNVQYGEGLPKGRLVPMYLTEEKLYTVAEVVEMLGMSERSVYRNIQSGKLEATEREVMVPTVRKFVTAEALERFKAEREG